MRDWPGRRRSRSIWISSRVSFMRGGQPSSVTPTPPPWDSPQVEMRNMRPKELPVPIWSEEEEECERLLEERLLEEDRLLDFEGEHLDDILW